MSGMNRTWGYALDRPDLVPAPGATVNVYQTGTTTHVAIYADAAGVTPLANPFLADSNGYWDFYTEPQRVDVRLSGTGITTPYTLGDVLPVPVYPNNVVNVKAYGATGNGTTSDQAAFQAALDAIKAAAVPATLQIPVGTYRLTGELTYTDGPPLALIGDAREGSQLVWDDTASRGLTIDATAPAVSSLLSSNAAIGDRTVNVANGALFTVGDWVFLDDSATNTGTLVTRAHGIVANAITLDDALPCALTTASAARLYNQQTHPMIEGVVIQHLTFACTTTTPVNKLTLLLVSRCAWFVVEDCHFNGSVGPTLTTRQTYNGWIRACIFENAITVAGAGIENQTATGLVIGDCSVVMCQFGITFASSPYCRVAGTRINGRQTNVALGRGIRFGQSSNFGLVTGCVIDDPNLYGIYAQDSAFVTITGNTISFTGSAIDVAEHGIQIGGFEQDFCHHCTITGNTIRGASGYGVAIAPTTVLGVQLHIVVSGNNISGCIQGGVLVFRVAFVAITGNMLSAPGSTVPNALIYVQSTGGGFCTIVGNILVNEDGTSVVGISTTNGTLGHNVINSNLFDETLGAITTDYSVSDTYGVPQPQHPLINTTQVATPATVVETTAWDIAVPAATFNAINQGWHLRAEFSLGADANNKTISVYCGDQVISGTTAENNKGLILDVRGYYVSTNGHMTFYVEMRISGTSVTPIFKYSGLTTTNAAPWTAIQHIKITMTNGSAVASDVVFQSGMFEWIGVPATAYNLNN